MIKLGLGGLILFLSFKEINTNYEMTIIKFEVVFMSVSFYNSKHMKIFEN